MVSARIYGKVWHQEVCVPFFRAKHARSEKGTAFSRTFSVHVGNPKGVNPLESEMFFHSLNQTVKEELGEESGIKDEPSAVVRNDDRKVLAQGLGVELVKVRRDPVHERELGWFGIPVRFFRFHFVDGIAA